MQCTVCNVFLRVTLQAFQLHILTNDMVYRRVMNSCLSWNLTCVSVNLVWAYLPDSKSIQWQNRRCHQCTHWEVVGFVDDFSYCQRFSILFTSDSDQKPLSLPENSLKSFSTIILEFVQIFNCNSILNAVHHIYTLNVVCYLAMPKLVLDLT